MSRNLWPNTPLPRRSSPYTLRLARSARSIASFTRRYAPRSWTVSSCPGYSCLLAASWPSKLGISRFTVVSAFEQLLAEGYIQGQVGSGTFVSRELPDATRARRISTPEQTARSPRLSQRGMLLAATRRSTAAGGGPAHAPSVPASPRSTTSPWPPGRALPPVSIASRRRRSSPMAQSRLPALRGHRRLPARGAGVVARRSR